jgi:IS30 family transposase
MYSIDGFKYYIVFIDHFTCYTWFYPLQHKSDVKPTFIRFKAIVKNYFNHKSITFYSDNGGEFTTLKDFFQLHGISHHTFAPHTPEHNGISERKHQHIVEIGLSLPTHTSLPQKFWSFAFSTTIYFINRMPSWSLQYFSPFELIFKKSPNHAKLCIFGCLCYPWLRSYSAHKLDVRSKPCIFLGYSLSQSAYICFDP